MTKIIKEDRIPRAKLAYVRNGIDGIHCPACGAVDSTNVIETRRRPSAIFRRRECACKFRFSTIEVEENLIVEFAQLIQRKIAELRGILSPEADE